MKEKATMTAAYTKIKINAKPEDIEKMKRMSSLFYEELGENPKEIDIVSFFYGESFKRFLESGEVEKRFAKITGKE